VYVGSGITVGGLDVIVGGGLGVGEGEKHPVKITPASNIRITIWNSFWALIFSSPLCFTDPCQ
jgi:hypothetical protein